MGNPKLPENAFRDALLEHEKQERINTGKIAAALVVVLMPAGVVLDHYYKVAVDDGYLGYFFKLRVACSFLAAIVWLLFSTPFGGKHYRLLGLLIPWLPAAFISWMILVTEGDDSPYYAGLNLILLAVSAVVHWSTRDSIIAVAGVIGMYALACLGNTHVSQLGLLFNNVYFIVLTGIIVVVGNHFFNRLRMREFTLRFELDQNRLKLEETNQKLVELDQVKSRFFANISHELRTPLTLLLAPLESLIQEPNRAAEESSRDLLLTMRSNGMRLLKLINDLLDLVRLESGRMEVKREPLDAAEFVNGLASAARQIADDKHIHLQTQIDPDLNGVLADRDKLEKVILNLLFNALKFTPAGGTVEVIAKREGEQFVLIVKDTGMGIAEKNLPFIFDRFWQADTSSKRKYQGVGIGLALVKELVELQSGEVVVQSKEGVGTTFRITLPFVRGEPVTIQGRSSEAEDGDAEAPANSSEEWLVNLYRRAEPFPAMTPVQESVRPVETWSRGKRPRVLVADDEPEMLRFLKSQLTRQYEVLEAVDGQQALEKAGQFLPDIILLDMMMPEKNGIEACKELRDRTATQNIPVVLLTARADEETKLAALNAGASDFLTKPFSTTELHVRLRNLVESYQFQRNLAKQNQVLEHTIDQLKETESQLVQSEKMASLGRLSAGMIHEINNPLNFATTGLFSLRGKEQFLAEEQRPEFVEILNDVDEGIRRVRDLVVSMRIFSYDEKTQASPESITLNEIIEPALRFLSHEWRDKVAVHQALPEDVTIWANKNKLIQVTVNLLQNSLDAFARKPFKDEQPAIWIEGETKENKGILTVRDNGEGIDPRNMDKIFDPFFTTKEIGEGMGLGLSICYRIVQQYSGRIHVRSELGKFTEFRLEFPASGTGTLAA